MSRARVLGVLAVVLAGCPEAPAPIGGNAPTVPDLMPVAATPVAKLVTVEGRVDLERDGGVSKAVAGPLFEDDVVATGPASSALLSDSAGRELELGEDTRFKVGAKLSSVEVLTGEIAFLSDEDGGAGWSGLLVRTPYGVARLSGGATGNLRFVDGGVLGSVTFGTFEFDVPDAGTRSAKAGESFGVTFGEFEFEASPVAPAPPAVDGLTLSVQAGKPQVKRPTDKRYAAAKAKESLPAGTAFQLPAGAAARLSGRHVDAVLASGSGGVAEGERTEGGQSVVALSKVIGALTLQFSGKGPAAVDLGDVQVGGRGESSVTVTQVGKKKRVEVKAGEVAVMVKGVMTTLKAGDAVLVDAGGAVAAPATRPGLVVNSVARVRVYADGVKNLALLLPDDTNRVQVARAPDFAAPFITGTVGKQVVVPLTSKAPLHFRLLDPQGQPTKQGRIDFLPDLASARDTTTRTDTVTETGQRATVFYQSRVPALTFQFSGADAKAWRFRLYGAEQLTTPIIDRKANEARLVLEPGVLKEGDFLWSATALDGNGAEKAGTRMNKLSVVYDNARTSLLIERPLNGERAEAGMTASGVAPRSAQVFINGKLVRPDDSGRFSVKVGAVDQVVFRVVTDETEAWWVRRLKR